MPLNVAKIKALEPKTTRYTVTDSAGLGLEVQPTGLMSWRYRYRLARKAAKINLGRYPDVGLSDARAKRDELAAAIRAGVSPAEQKRKERVEALRSVTVREFAERYYTEVVEKARKNPKTVLRYLRQDVFPKMGPMPLAKIDAQDMQEIIFRKRNAGHGQAAVALRNLLKRIWDYAIVCGAATINPAHATPVKYIAKAKKRTRALSEAEIGVFLRAVDQARFETRYKIALLLILLNLVRKSELLLARWEHIDLDRGEWLIPEENSKTGKDLIIFLSRQSVELYARLKPEGVGDGFVLPMGKSRNQPITAGTLNRLLKAVPANLPHFTIHDLRRTGSTRLNEMEYNELWIEKALNHTKKGVSGIYNRAEYAKQRKEMLQAWADHLDSLRGFPEPA